MAWVCFAINESINERVYLHSTSYTEYSEALADEEMTFESVMGK